MSDISKLEFVDEEKIFNVRYGDIDTNKHVITILNMLLGQ